MKWVCISWVVLIVGYMIAAYWWAARAEKRINDQIKRCMDDLEKTVEEHKKALKFLYEHADKACQVRQNLIRRLQDVERWIAWSGNHGNSGWNDDWIVEEAEIMEAWKQIVEELEPYAREEEKG